MSAETADPRLAAAPGEATELAISSDMAKRGVVVAPILIAIGGLIWGMDGVFSTAFAIALVLGNLLLSAVLMNSAAKVSLGMLLGACLFGYLVRLGLIMVAVLLVRDESWISLPALGASIIVTHLGLLIWELRYVALTFSYPGLKPGRDTR